MFAAVFWILVVVINFLTGGVFLIWLWGPFVMIIPFCCDGCCARPPLPHPGEVPLRARLAYVSRTTCNTYQFRAR